MFAICFCARNYLLDKMTKLFTNYFLKCALIFKSYYWLSFFIECNLKKKMICLKFLIYITNIVEEGD